MFKSQQLRRIEEIFFNLTYDAKYYGECWIHAIDAYHDQLGTEGVLGQLEEQESFQFNAYDMATVGTEDYYYGIIK